MASNQRGEGAKACLSFDERPRTPENIRKYRKSGYQEPGKRITHPGLVDDVDALVEKLKDTRLGARSDRSSSHVGDLFKRTQSGSISDFIEQKKESIYKTVQREPLGKPYVRGHNFEKLEQAMKRKKAQPKDSESAKDLIYSSGEHKAQDEEKVREQYIISHRSFQPGEQHRRKYNWKHIDPENHRFGVVDSNKGKEEGVAFCLKHDSDDTSIGNISVANHRSMTTDKLGKSKYRGNVDEETIKRLEERIARKSAKKQSYTAQDCIEGDYSIDQQLPDDDLGKATKPGWRNNDLSRVYGAPSIKTDVDPPAHRSLADSQNYGDTVQASELIYPSAFASSGVDESEYLEPKSSSYIRSIMEGIGYPMSDETFQQVYREACLLATDGQQDSGEHIVSVKCFLYVFNNRD